MDKVLNIIKIIQIIIIMWGLVAPVVVRIYSCNQGHSSNLPSPFGLINIIIVLLILINQNFLVVHNHNQGQPSRSKE